MIDKMYYKYYFFVACLWLCLSCENQTNKTNTTAEQKQTLDSGLAKKKDTPDYLLPKELRFEQFKEYYEQENNQFILGGFYPIGWSKDHKFAYVIEPPDEATGAYFFELRIQNMITDKVEWEFKYNTLADTLNTAEDLASVWKLKKRLFEQKLKEYQIVQSNDHPLKAFPIRAQGFTLTTQLETTVVSKEKSKFGFAYINGIDFSATSDAGKKYPLYTKKYKESFLTSIQELGYLKSPNGPQTAIILGGIQRGWEGPPHLIKYTIVGCSLKKELWK